MANIRGHELAPSYLAQAFFRFVQLVLALTVVGLYGTDLNRAHKAGKYSDGKWVYAVVTASLSAVTAAVYLVPLASRVPFLFAWDALLFVLWIALFGVFGQMYIPEHAEGSGGVQRMKNAVWVDLTNAMLWLVSAVGGGVWARGAGRTRWTGRAKV